MDDLVMETTGKKVVEGCWSGREYSTRLEAIEGTTERV
jgi:hypothetical protein